MSPSTKGLAGLPVPLCQSCVRVCQDVGAVGLPRRPWSLPSPLSPPYCLGSPVLCPSLKASAWLCPRLPLTPAHLPQERVCSHFPNVQSPGVPGSVSGAQRGCRRWSVRHTRGSAHLPALTISLLPRSSAPGAAGGGPHWPPSSIVRPWSPCLSCVSVSSLHACCRCLTASLCLFGLAVGFCVSKVYF